MPAPTSTSRCGFCQRSFAVAGPVTYRLTSWADGYRWTVDDDEVATAVCHNGTWDVYDLSGDSRPALTLVPVEVEGSVRVALVDHRSRLVATYAPDSGTSNGIGVIRDSYDRIMLLVRGDGPTGVHVIDAAGDVVALASRLPERDHVGLDVLVLSRQSDPAPGALLVLGLGLLLELARVGELRPAA